MIVMDRENLHVPGRSHVMSTTHDLEELDAFRVGGHPARPSPGALAALLTSSSSPGSERWRRGRSRFERTSDMLRYTRRSGAGISPAQGRAQASLKSGDPRRTRARSGSPNRASGQAGPGVASEMFLGARARPASGASRK